MGASCRRQMRDAPWTPHAASGPDALAPASCRQLSVRLAKKSLDTDMDTGPKWRLSLLDYYIDFAWIDRLFRVGEISHGDLRLAGEGQGGDGVGDLRTRRRISASIVCHRPA
jgi:hypothetical protein